VKGKKATVPISQPHGFLVHLGKSPEEPSAIGSPTMTSSRMTSMSLGVDRLHPISTLLDLQPPNPDFTLTSVLDLEASLFQQPDKKVEPTFLRTGPQAYLYLKTLELIHPRSPG
jgi:hypothetical protein